MKTQYVALLRGVNVGGKGTVSMSVLKERLAAMGLENVASYINSGNVIFETARPDIDKLTNEIAQDMAKTFNYQTTLILYSYEQFKQFVEHAPKGFGSKPDLYRSDVMFLMPPLTAAEAMSQITLKEGVDSAYQGNDVVYFARLTARATQSQLGKIITLPMYKNMTIRSWNTTTKLLALMDARASTSGKP